MRNNVSQWGVGANDNIAQQIDKTHSASRISIRPLDHQDNLGRVGGHYRMTFGYSNTAAKPAAGSDIVSLRWTDSTFLFVLLRLQAWITTTTVYTATLNQDIELFVARGFTVAPSAGTQVIPAAGGQVLRSNQMKKSGLDGSSGVLWNSSGDLLTTGTRTLDTQSIGYGSFQNPITTPNTPANILLYENRESGQHPLVLAASEGLVIQTPIGNGQAAGVSKFRFVMDWAEIPAL